MLHLTRAKENPILSPTKLPWEDMAVFNPGVIMYKDHIRLLYRALGKKDQISRIGCAESTDGLHFTRQEFPLYYGGHHPEETLGIEDMRAVKIDDMYYLTYTMVSPRQSGIPNQDFRSAGLLKPQIGLSTTKDFVDFLDYGVIIPEKEGKDATVFPQKFDDEYLLLFREEEGTTFLADSPHLTYWPERYVLFAQRPGMWDSKRAGIGSPPIRTEKGWLLFYHGVDDKNIYRLGILFLDLQDPRKILYRSDQPIFEPETSYEVNGIVPNVVFTCGVVEKDDTYYVYYGGGDVVIGLATVLKKDVLALL